MKKKIIRCCKCLVTLERLKKDRICSYLIRIIKDNGAEDYICSTCFNGW